MLNIPAQFEKVGLGLGKDVVAWRHFYVYEPDSLPQRDVVEFGKALLLNAPATRCLQQLVEDLRSTVSEFTIGSGSRAARDIFDSVVDRFQNGLPIECFAEGSQLPHAYHVRACLYTRAFNLGKENVIWQLGLKRILSVNNSMTDLAFAKWIIECTATIPSIKELFEGPPETEPGSLVSDDESPGSTGKASTSTTIMDAESLGVTPSRKTFDVRDLVQKRRETKKALKQIEDATKSLNSSQTSFASRGSCCSSPEDGK